MDASQLQLRDTGELAAKMKSTKSGVLGTITRKLRKSVAQRGLVRTAIRCAVFPLECGRRMAQYWAPSRRHKRRSGIEFDRKYHVETCHDVDMNWMARIESENWQYGTGYDPAPIESVSETLRNLAIHFEDFTFIDLGSGKGRALFLAAHFPFAEIIGVEFCPRLHAIAERNISTYYNPGKRCHNIRAVYGDATEFAVPNGPLVYYLNQPFQEPVLRKVVDKILDSHRASARKIIVLYYDPDFFSNCQELFRNGVFKERVRNGDEYVIYETP